MDFGRHDRSGMELFAGPIMLRPPEPRDGEAWLSLRQASRAHLTRWEPDWLPADATLDAFKSRVRSQVRERRLGAALPLFIFRRGDGLLVGGVTLASIRRHASSSAQLGYWIGAPFLRRGYALAAVNAVLDHAFNGLGLHRIEAASQPANQASCNLLKKAGFQREGLARDYLFINGAWRDHTLFARLARDAAPMRESDRRRSPEAAPQWSAGALLTKSP